MLGLARGEGARVGVVSGDGRAVVGKRSRGREKVLHGYVWCRLPAQTVVVGEVGVWGKG